MYKFVVLNIQTNKINFLVFLKCRLNSRGFHQLIIKFKNTCKYINKTIFLEFLYLKMLNHALYCLCYYYLSKYDFFLIFERLEHK
jgi:hypothetical protein